MYAGDDTQARFLAVSYPFGGDLDHMVGPELVKTWDYLRFDLAFPTRAYFSLPNGYELLKEFTRVNAWAARMKAIGYGRPLVRLPVLERLDERARFRLVDTRLVGGDLRLTLRPQ